MDSLRKEIDGIDDQILILLEKRSRLALRAGQIKRDAGRAIKDEGREEAVLSRLAAKASGPLGAEGVRTVFSSVIEVCRNIQ